MPLHNRTESVVSVHIQHFKILLLYFQRDEDSPRLSGARQVEADDSDLARILGHNDLAKYTKNGWFILISKLAIHEWGTSIADIRVSETETWHQLNDSNRIGSKICNMHDASWTNFESSFLCPIGIVHFKSIVPCFSFRILK